MRLILVRHGETDQHVKGILLGQKIDAGLNRNGISQATKLALRLKKEKIDTIFSSDLKRAKETARIINDYHDLKIKYTKKLRERNFGVFQGKQWRKLFRGPKKELLVFWMK